MIERICFLCHDSLSFNDYISTNAEQEEFLIYRKITEKDRLCKIIWIKEFKQWDLVKVWESNDIELICCNCRRFLDTLLNEKEALWKLLESFDDERLLILKELGIIDQKDLQKLKNKK